MNFLLIILIIFSFDNANSVDNCVKHIAEGSNLCETCAANYVLNKDRTCSQCGNDQVIYNNYCFTKIDHCEEYILYQEGQKCDDCADKYEPNEDNSACRLFIANCAEYKNNEKCQSCKTGYLLNEALTKCIAIANCRGLDENDKCNACEEGFHLIAVTGTDPYCNPNIENCINYDTTNPLICAKCQEGYKGDNCVFEPCLEKDNKNVCTKCKSGYYLIGDNCLSLEGCDTYDETVTSGEPKCTKCKSGYYLIGDNCLSIKGCDTYDDTVNVQPKCRECKSGYYLIGDNCLSLEGCDTYDDTVTSGQPKCTKCTSGYYLIGDNCLSIKGCDTYDDTVTSGQPKCTNCTSGYYLIGDNCLSLEGCDTYGDTVTVQPKCRACKNGYKLKLDRTDCIEIENCIEYDDDGSKCVRCQTGFRLSNDGKSCPAVINNCKNYKDNNLCDECNTGSISNDGGVSCEIEHCENQINDQCQQCQTYYIKENNICIPCDTEGKSCDITIENCKTYQLTDDSGVANVTCKQCTTGYSEKYNGLACVKDTAADGTAITEILGCISYTSGNKCGKCFQGYELINDKCYLCPGPYITGNGITCSLPHFNCALHDNSGNCIVCPNGYQFTRNHQYCIEQGTNDPTKNNNSCVLNLNILILILFALLL